MSAYTLCILIRRYDDGASGDTFANVSGAKNPAFYVYALNPGAHLQQCFKQLSRYKATFPPKMYEDNLDLDIIIIRHQKDIDS